NLDWATAAALPNAAMGSYFPLRTRAKVEEGETVLINGGTGMTGRMAIQLAKFFGASKVIVSGHIKGKEQELRQLGADALLSTELEDAVFVEKLKDCLDGQPLHVVVDYLWGRSTELIINHLTGNGKGFADFQTRIVTVGS